MEAGRRQRVVLAQHEYELDAVVISGKGVEAGGVGDGEFDEGKSVDALNVNQPLELNNLLVNVFDHGLVIVAYCQLGLE